MRIIESIEVHSTLNPKLFGKDNKLYSDIREKILEIVNQFNNDLEVPLNIVDIHIVGSNASYNYTEYSDIDVHVISNFDLLSLDTSLVQALYNSERSRFNKRYDIKIKGLDVEMYVEDIKSGAVSNGIYSIYQDEWIKFPTKIKNVHKYDTSIDVSKFVPRINNALASDSVQVVEDLINQLYLMRKNSIAVEGEYGKGNQVFKDIRNLGLLDALKEKLNELVSKELSLESLLNIHEAINKMNKYS